MFTAMLVYWLVTSIVFAHGTNNLFANSACEKESAVDIKNPIFSKDQISQVEGLVIHCLFKSKSLINISRDYSHPCTESRSLICSFSWTLGSTPCPFIRKRKSPWLWSVEGSATHRPQAHVSFFVERESPEKEMINARYEYDTCSFVSLGNYRWFAWWWLLSSSKTIQPGWEFFSRKLPGRFSVLKCLTVNNHLLCCQASISSWQ